MFNSTEIYHDKKRLPATLDWLCKRFGVEGFEHSFRDQFAHVSIWDGVMFVRLYDRCPAQKALFEAIPAEYKGAKQRGTGILVNIDVIYIDLTKEFEMVFPSVTGSKRLREIKNRDHSYGSTYYTYDHEIFLSDGTSIFYHNQQSDIKDFSEWILRTEISERYFYAAIGMYNEPIKSLQLK